MLDALKLAASVKSRLVDYCASELATPREDVARRARALWSGPAQEGGLVQDLWIEGAFPALPSPETLGELVARGHFPSALAQQLDKRGAVPLDRPLFMHQAEALASTLRRGGGPRPAVVVTAGTGAGKTEAFLLPMLRTIVEERRAPNGGVGAVVLYPMNALVNDQVARLYAWLQGQTDTNVSLFHFTSETPEDKADANRLGVESWDKCRFRTRKQARGLEDAAGARTSGGPVPDIVVTNYSMLEYMLSRPQDEVFFGENLRVVVLDEAHLYAGTLAAEMTLLLRRLLARCGKRPEDVLSIASSATIGSGKPDELASFGASLFSRSPSQVIPVIGKHAPCELASETVDGHGALDRLCEAETFVRDMQTLRIDDDGEPRMVEDDPATCQWLTEKLLIPLAGTAWRSGEPVSSPARLLHTSLRYSSKIRDLDGALRGGPVSLSALSVSLWGEARADSEAERRQRATLVLLTLAAAAREHIDRHPIVPHRLHVLVRGAEGLSVCLNPGCSAPSDRHALGRGALVGGPPGLCPWCESRTLPLYRCTRCGDVALGLRVESGGASISGPLAPHLPNRAVMCAAARPQSHDESVEGREYLYVDSKSGEILGAGDGEQLAKIDACPSCGQQRGPIPADDDEEDESRGFRGFIVSNRVARNIVAETVVLALPPIASRRRKWLPAEGRRLLAFSDSRRDAAYLGPKLAQQHERLVFRAALARAIRREPSPDELQLLQDDLAAKERQLAKAGASLRPKLEEQIGRLSAEIRTWTTGWSLDEVVKALAADDVLEELLDRDMGSEHAPHAWIEDPDRERNRNWLRIRDKKNLTRLIAREVAMILPRLVDSLVTLPCSRTLASSSLQ